MTNDMPALSSEDRDKLDAASFRRLLAHLDDNKDVQNIDLMILAGFCRNCLSKWYKAEADALGVDVSDNEARRRVYGMDYGEWKEKFQKPATQEQLDAMKARQSEN